MARVKSSGLIQSISGKVGDIVFVRYRGGLMVRKSPKSTDVRSIFQLNVRRNFVFLLKSFYDLPFCERVLWEEYGHNLPCYDNLYSGLIKRPRGKLSGQNAYLSVNRVLASCGFSPVNRPPHPSIPRPSALCTDLPQYSQHKNGEARFKVWLSSAYSYKCVVQIWVRAQGSDNYRYLARVIEVSQARREVVLTKIRLHKDKKKDKKIVESPFTELKKIEFRLQLRAVSEKGVFSIPSALYVLEVVSD